MWSCSTNMYFGLCIFCSFKMRKVGWIVWFGWFCLNYLQEKGMRREETMASVFCWLVIGRASSECLPEARHGSGACWVLAHHIVNRHGETSQPEATVQSNSLNLFSMEELFKWQFVFNMQNFTPHSSCGMRSCWWTGAFFFFSPPAFRCWNSLLYEIQMA